METLNVFFEALRHLSRNESIVQKAWESWNGIEWETEFDYGDIKEGDCVVYSDFTINFIENGWGKNFANQNGGWVLYENSAHDLSSVLEVISSKMDELKEHGYGSDDC
jgi:hypothetical protein